MRPLRPEVLEILADIAGDADASLLRAPAKLRGVPGLTEPVSPRRAGLKSAERALLEAYRDDVQHLLAEACRKAFYEDAYWKRFLNPHVTGVTAPALVTHADAEKRRTYLAHDIPPEADVDEQLALLQACVSDGRAVAPVQLALATIRLRRSDFVETAIAYDLVREGRFESAEAMLGSITRNAESGLTASCAWSGIAASALRQRQYERCADAYRRAADLTPDRAAPIASWLGMACYTGRRSEARRAAAILDDLGTAAAGAAAEASARAFVHLREDGFLEAAIAYDGLAADRERWGPKSRRLSDVVG